MKQRPTRHISGHAAEQYTCYDLAKRGFRVVSTPFESAPYDILADCNGRLLKVQVKGTAKPASKKNGAGVATLTYHFNITQSQLPQCDIVAFVALDLEKVIYRQPASLGTASSLWVPVSRMRKGDDVALFQLVNDANM